MEKETIELSQKGTTIIRNGVTLHRKDNNIIEIDHSIENPHIFLHSFMDFHFIELMNQINTDIYKVMEYTVLDVNSINIVLLLNHFFKDFGSPRQYLNLKITKSQTNNLNMFNISNFSLDKTKPSNIPEEAELILVDNICICLEIINPHKIHVNSVISLEENPHFKAFIDKLIGNLLCKIFIRLKRFIENIVI